MAKRSRRNPGQSLRGSSDLHAWTDSACYLVRRADDRLQASLCSRSRSPPAASLGWPLTSPSRCSSTAFPQRRRRLPRRCVPRSATPISPSPEPPCGNACASTTRASGPPWKLSNNVASRSAAPPVGTFRHDHHRYPPIPSPLTVVPSFCRSAPGTRSERNASLPTLRATYRASNLGCGRATQQVRPRFGQG